MAAWYRFDGFVFGYIPNSHLYPNQHTHGCWTTKHEDLASQYELKRDSTCANLRL